MIKRQCRVLVSKEQSEALKRGQNLNCRCSPTERRAGCGLGVMDGLSQVGGRHMPVEEHACMHFVCLCVCVHKGKNGQQNTHLVPPWRQPDCRGLSGSKASSSCHQSTTCRNKLSQHTHTLSVHGPTFSLLCTHTHAMTSSRHLSSDCQSAGPLPSLARWPVQKF